MRKILTIVVLAAALAGTAWLLTPPRLAGNVSVPDIPGDIDSWLADTESAAAREFKLIPGTEKRIRWQQPGVRTRYSVVYLHGFSATRQEIAPTNERVADGLGANLFETRLRGHGHGERPMHEVRAEDWLADGIEALQIAAILGDEVIVIGTSTGATLALALADHPLMQNVAAMVFISPNMAPADPNAVWMTRPAGPLLAQLIAGDTRSWVAHNDAQERYWSTSYPTAATVEVMRLVDRANRLASMPLNAAVLMLLSPDDTVISPAAARRTFGEINAPLKRLDEVDGGGDPSNHVLAGDILSPDATDVIASRIIDFVIDALSRPAS